MWDERELLPLLTVTNGSLRGASFRLTPGVRVIGRAAGVDVPLDDVKVSRRHATVAVGEGPTLLADAGSMNGTWVNEERITGPRELCDGDRLRIGQVELRFFDPATAATVPVNGRYAPGWAPARPVVPAPRSGLPSTMTDLLTVPDRAAAADAGTVPNRAATVGAATATGPTATVGAATAAGPAATDGAAAAAWPAAPTRTATPPAAAPVRLATAGVSPAPPLAATARTGRLLWAAVGLLAAAGLTWAYLVLG